MKKLVLGMGISGKSAAEFLLNNKIKVMGADINLSGLKDNESIKKLMLLGLELISDESSVDFSQIDEIIVSPGISPNNKLYQEALVNNKPVIGEVELAAKHLLDKKWIGITGTNGKTTVTLLVDHLLKNNNIKSKALGNVGVPLCNIISEITDEIIVAELSSYQIETMRSKVLDVGLIMNITADHLDRYKDMHEYALAKIKITDSLKEAAVLYVHEDIFKHYYNQLDTSKTLSYGYHESNYFYTDLTSLFIKGIKIGDLPSTLKGKKSHEVENYMAAFIIAYHFKIDPKAIEKSFYDFKKPPHRLEFVLEIDGCKFVDDSKGTNLDAVIRAVESFDENIVLIAGGVHKGASYIPWKQSFAKKVRAIFAIGQSASLIYEDIGPFIPVFICKSLDEAVFKSYEFAEKGEIILLSPGCSSFDMFKDYAHRGEEFKKSVFKLYTNLLKN
jgi:UDP-N-acetylmuramoylalanine--D-glutamate ligase